MCSVQMMLTISGCLCLLGPVQSIVLNWIVPKLMGHDCQLISWCQKHMYLPSFVHFFFASFSSVGPHGFLT